MVDHRDPILDIEQYVSTDRRFHIYYGENLGVYHNFERGLNVALSGEAKYLCFSDQDDVWLPNKIENCLSKIQTSKSDLVHSDLSAIDSEELIIEKSVWLAELRNEEERFSDLILRNSVTGCTMFFTRKLAKSALPFPPQGRVAYWHHDLWMTMVAAATKDMKIERISEQLVLYRQHGENTIGLQKGVYAPANFRQAIVDYRIRKTLARHVKNRIVHPAWGIRLLLILVCSPLSPLFFIGKGFSLKRENIRGIKLTLSLAVGGVLSIFYSASQLIRLQFVSMKSKIWRLLRRIALGLFRDQISRFSVGTRINDFNYLVYDKNGFSQAKRIILLLPALRESSIFGGAATLIKFGLSQAKKMNRELLIISTDVPGEIEEKAILGIFGYSNNEIQLEIFTNSEPVVFSDSDAFMASAWWNFESIDHLRKKTGSLARITYLIQDYEPGFYAWSDEYARALRTYRYQPHVNYVFNTNILREYFTKEIDPRFSRNQAISPQLAATKDRSEGVYKSGINIFFYSRPSVKRNLFATGAKALQTLIQEEPHLKNKVTVFPVGEFLGAREKEALTGVPCDFSFAKKLSLEEYKNVLSFCHLSLSLMLSPHPSYPPLESAQAGLWCVTNSYSNKNSDSFGDQILVCDPDADSIFEGLLEAIRRYEAGLVPVLTLSEMGEDLESIHLEE
jgi:hypothetical protein